NKKIMEILENVSLKPYNTFGVEVTAHTFVKLEKEDDIHAYLDNYGMRQSKTLVLGGGSNILFTRDFDGTVLKIDLQGVEIIREEPEHVYLKAAAGVLWDELVQFAVSHGYGGLENLSLIPGHVGAAPVQNIGAYGVEQKDYFVELEAISLREQQKRIFTAEECRFGYRDSIFKNALAKKYIITSVTYRLDKQPELRTGYGRIREELQAMDVKEPSVADVSKAVIRIRRAKLPDTEVTGNAGSFFKNPVVSVEKHDKLKKAYPNLVSFEIDNDHYKLAAGWLIEQDGWKGKAVGHAAVHKQQALVLINLGKARGNEVLHLARMIRMSVEKKFGVKLEYEVNIV
ncbi:MAG: UDP-N-acetylmuramate dehydrogenase, partial [Bacteroidales bacterium]